MDGEFNVFEERLTDGSKVYNVAGYTADGLHRIKAGCISLDQANELSAILRRLAWIEVANA
jgi:hypothetical protein